MGGCRSKEATSAAPSRPALKEKKKKQGQVTSHAVVPPASSSGGWTTGKPKIMPKKAYKTNRQSPPPRSSNYEEIDLDYLEEETIDIWDETNDAITPAGVAKKPAKIVKIKDWKKVVEHINDDMSSVEMEDE